MSDTPIKNAVRRMAFPQEPSPLSLADALARLDEATGVPGHLPDQLEHYLSRRSYVKAWDWLERHPDWKER